MKKREEGDFENKRNIERESGMNEANMGVQCWGLPQRVHIYEKVIDGHNCWRKANTKEGILDGEV